MGFSEEIRNYTDEELDEVIRESERSGWVDEEEVNAFFERWKNML